MTGTALDTTGGPSPERALVPWWLRVLAQARFDLVTALRNGEQVLVTLVVPTLVLAAASRLPIVPGDSPGARAAVAAPGVLVLAVLSSAFTSLSISTAFDRRYGALRLLGTTPLGRTGLVAGRLLSVVALVVVQALVVSGEAIGLGWRPSAGALAGLVPVLALGTVVLGALGMLLAGSLRPEAVLAVANLVWILLVGLGGVVRPLTGIAGRVAGLLPSGSLAELARAVAAGRATPVGALVVTLVWAVIAVVAAVRWFRWD